MDPIFAGLTDMGRSIGGALIQKQIQGRENEKQIKLEGLLSSENPDLNAVAAMNPEIANYLTKKNHYAQLEAQKQQLADLDAVGNIASIGATMAPVEARKYLNTQLNQGGHSEAIQKEIAEALSMDDDEMMNDLRLGAQYSKEHKSAAMKEFEYKTTAAGLKKGTEDYQKAARVDLGLEARAGSSAQERIATDSGLGESVATQKANEAGAVEAAKLNSQLLLKPKIAEAVKKAEADATAKGETLSAYKRAKAALPGLNEVSAKLKSLADVATYTTSGKLFNLAAKELGFGATKGATARTQMRAIIDNQVLPLLRETFGAQFTEKEGERLANTLMDIDATPEEKKASLDSFIKQKIRNLEVQERELFDAEDSPKSEVKDQDQAALEWAQANPDDPRAQQIMQIQGGQ